VPRIGEIEAWIRENPFQNGQFVGWRKELQELGSRIASQRSTGTLVEKRFQMSTNAESKLSWCGEVSGLNLDGTVEVTRFDWIVANYPLERLTRLYDGIEQLEDEWDESASEGDRSFSDEGERPWIMETDGTWRPEQADAGNEWEPVHDGMDIDEDVDSVQRDDTVERGETLIWPEQVSNFRTLETILIPKIKPEYMEGLDTGQGLRVESCSPLEECEVSTMLESVDFQGDHDIWNRFEISATAPPDHAFFSSSPDRPSKSFLGRLRREYHILATSLPDNILVRAYEDRTDLLRSLIIGPENTPYEDAPFVIDWMLDSNFPHSPPVAHFLSWTNGNGRVNPNLYEEGKVCLSILGTWTGDKNETWSAARSSLLQAFVSIQGLVLVKEPWFCEPAYERLRGTEEGTVNSRLYSEKAYVLSRGFVRRALEIPLGGLETEIAHLFYGKKRLHKVVQDAQRLIQKSRESLEVTLEDQDIAVPRLTAGGIIALERTLNRLCGWLDRCPS
jgi:ubiquitin-conjugating enzyme E2 O